jgi:hypothetical protein
MSRTKRKGEWTGEERRIRELDNGTMIMMMVIIIVINVECKKNK